MHYPTKFKSWVTKLSTHTMHGWYENLKINPISLQSPVFKTRRKKIFMWTEHMKIIRVGWEEECEESNKKEKKKKYRKHEFISLVLYDNKKSF
jgi:hypothetical protein